MPNRSSLYSNTGMTLLLTPATRTADANSTGFDTRNSDDVTIAFIVGASGDTLSGSVYIECELEESDDNSVWTDVADVDVTNSVTGTNTGTAAKIDDPAEDDTIVKVGYKGYKRYVRGVLNVTGTHSNGTPTAIIALSGGNRIVPVA